MTTPDHGPEFTAEVNPDLHKFTAEVKSLHPTGEPLSVNPPISDLFSNLRQQVPRASTQPTSWPMGVQVVAPFAASDLTACSGRWRSLRGGEGVFPPSTVQHPEQASNDRSTP